MVNYRLAVMLIMLALSAGFTNAQINATGGTITTSGVYVIHTFTTSANFTVLSGTQNITVLVVGGGGGGGGSISGGGGGGGVLYNTSFAASAQTYNITVGAGGTNGSGTRQGSNGSDSSFSTMLAYGGGGGGAYGGTTTGKNGGSGGGGSANDASSPAGGTGTSGQGTSGGAGRSGTNPWSGAGGGGANQTGSAGGTSGGNGGNGSGIGISGTLTYYGGGGGGGHYDGSGSGSGGIGGLGGAGNGSEGNPGNQGQNASANTGGGGGGAGNAGSGGLGGSGIVIISYDNSSYANVTDSVTGVQAVGYNGASISAGILLTDAVNDYIDTTFSENYTTSFSWSAWVKKNTTVNCQDGGNIIGRAYDWRLFTGGGCEIIVNVQNSSGSDVTHYNASLVFGNSTWVYVTAVFDLTNERSYVYVNNILRSNMSQKGVEQLASSKTLRLGGNPTTGLYFNGSIANVTIWNTTLDSANRTYLMNNGTPYCYQLAHWWAFNSTPPSCLENGTPTVTYDLYVNITVENTTIRTLPENFRGAHTAENLQNPAYSSGLRDHTKDLAVVDTTKIMAYRKDYDLANFCPTYSGNPALPCTFTTTYGSNYNITSVKNMVEDAANRSIKVHFVDDGATDWGADNSSKCTYGSNAPDFNYTSCDWANNTIHANAINQFLDAVDCDLYPGTCVHEGRNEPYLASGTVLTAAAGTFYYRNNTVTCAQRVTGQMVEWNQTTPLIRAVWGDDIEYWSPAFNVGYHPCGEVMAEQFMSEHPRGGNNSPDFMNDHEYSSSNPPVLNEDFDAAEAVYSAGGYAGYWGITESGLNNNALNYGSQDFQMAQFMHFFIYYQTNTTAQRILFFQFDGSESYIIYNGTSETIRYPGKVLNATKFSDATSGTLRTCTTTNVNVSCSYVAANNTKGILLLSNRNNQTMLIQTVSISGANITAAASNYNGSTGTVYSSNLVNLSLSKYAIDGLNITMEGADITAPTITNRTEWSNSSALQVNITTDEAANVSINYGTDYTNLTGTGSYVTYTGFLTNVSLNMTGLISDTNYHYTIRVCDSLGNCRDSAIFSEFTKNASIYFTSTTPSSATPSIAEPNNQNFTYTLSNYDNLTMRITWRLNGTNVSSCYGYDSCNFTGNYSSSGTYVYNVSIETDVAFVNNITYQWTLTVNDTPATYAYVTANDLYNNASINNFSVEIGIRGLSSDLMCRQPIANESVSCGGTAGGNYTFSANTINFAFDKPSGAIGMILETRAGDSAVGIVNTTLPTACWDAYSTWVSFQGLSNTGSYDSEYKCYNGTAFISLTGYGGGAFQSSGLENKTYFYDGNMSTGIMYIDAINNWTQANGNDGATLWGAVAHFNMSNVSSTYINRSTTNGTIIFNSTEIDLTAVHTVAFESTGYFNRTYSSQSLASNFTGYLLSGVAQFLAYNQTNASVTSFNITLNGVTYASTNTSIFIPSTAFNATFSKTGYANVTTEFSAGALYNGTLNFSVTESALSLIFNDPGLLLENETYNLTANVSANVAGNWLVEWFRNGASVFTEYVAQVGVSTWEWVVGYEDSGDYNITVNGTFNSSGVYNGSIETESLIVTVDDTYPAPLIPLGIEPNGGSYEYSIPLLCHIDYTPIAPYHFEYVYSINGSNYTAMNVNYSKPFQQFDISSDAYGSNYTFGCRVYSVSGISNYTYSNTFAKVNKNNFYMFYPQGQTSYQAMVPYTLGYVMEAENTIGATIYAGFVDCTGSGLWDYTFRYSTTNETTVRETFSCLNARGKAQTTIGMVLFKNNSNSWEGIGCKGLEYTENYCAVYKTYEVNVK